MTITCKAFHCPSCKSVVPFDPALPSEDAVSPPDPAVYELTCPICNAVNVISAEDAFDMALEQDDPFVEESRHLQGHVRILS